MSDERIPAVAVPTAEHHREPFGIGESSPRISWKTTAPAGWTQHAYEIEAVRVDGTSRTGWVASRDSVLVPWPLRPLTSREACEVRVRVRGTDRAVSGWGPPLRSRRPC